MPIKNINQESFFIFQTFILQHEKIYAILFTKTGKKRSSYIIWHKMRFTRYNGGYEEALIQLHRSAMEGISHGYLQEDEESDIRSIESIYLDGGGEFLIGFEDGKLIAMGGFKIIKEGVAELKRMRIAPELQGHGIGSELLRQLELTAQKKKLKNLVLETAISRPKTLHFYRSHGYTETGEKFFGTQKTICFEKTLEDLPDKTVDPVKYSYDSEYLE